jgi:hypothetical protein
MTPHNGIVVKIKWIKITATCFSLDTVFFPTPKYEQRRRPTSLNKKAHKKGEGGALKI